MALVFPNRVWMTTATTGTGTITLGAAQAGYLTFAEAGVADADTANYTIIDGNDFECGVGTYTSSGTTFSRDTVTVSKISGTPGTSKLNLSGAATIFLTQLSANVMKGPASATNEGIARFDAATGKLLKNSGVLISDTNVLTVPALLDLSGASAGQIKFPATQNASSDANTLDDYEEGTFTPAFAASGCTFNYAADGQVGTYTKIGRLVFFQARLALATSGNTLASATLTVTGFPFSSLNITRHETTFPVRWQAATTSYNQVVAQILANGSAIIFLVNTTEAVSLNTQPNADALLHATNGSQIWISGSIQVQ